MSHRRDVVYTVRVRHRKENKVTELWLNRRVQRRPTVLQRQLFSVPQRVQNAHCQTNGTITSQSHAPPAQKIGSLLNSTRRLCW